MTHGKAEKVLHLGFFQDAKARCGSPSMSRSSSPALVTCMKCIERAEAAPPAAVIELHVALSLERRAVVGHLAAIHGKTAETFLQGMLEREVNALRIPLGAFDAPEERSGRRREMAP